MRQSVSVCRLVALSLSLPLGYRTKPGAPLTTEAIGQPRWSSVAANTKASRARKSVGHEGTDGSAIRALAGQLLRPELVVVERQER
jgi:hypothetical protein